MSLGLNWDLSPLPSTSLPPLPRYWAFCSAPNVFIGKRGATKSTREGLESKRAKVREGRIVESEETFLFSVCFWVRGDLGSLSLSLSFSLSASVSLFPLTHSSPAARQVSPWPAPPPPQLDSSSFWLATLQQVRDVAGCGRRGRGATGQTGRARGHTAGNSAELISVCRADGVIY